MLGLSHPRRLWSISHKPVPVPIWDEHHSWSTICKHLGIFQIKFQGSKKINNFFSYLSLWTSIFLGIFKLYLLYYSTVSTHHQLLKSLFLDRLFNRRVSEAFAGWEGEPRKHTYMNKELNSINGIIHHAKLIFACRIAREDLGRARISTGKKLWNSDTQKDGSSANWSKNMYSWALSDCTVPSYWICSRYTEDRKDLKILLHLRAFSESSTKTKTKTPNSWCKNELPA